MEQPASHILHSSLLKIIVVLLGILCTVALCFPSATQLAHYYQDMGMVRGLPVQYSTFDYLQLYAPDLSSVLAFDRKTDKGIVWDYATQHITQRIDPGPPSEGGGLAWSPDTRYLLYDRQSDTAGPYLDLWDLTMHRRVFSVTRESELGINFDQAVWSPDHTRIALLWGGSLTLIDASTGKVLVSYYSSTDEMTLRTIAWSPNSQRIVAGYSNDSMIQLRLLNPDTLKTMSQTLQTKTSSDEQTYRNMQLIWSPDGTAFAASFGKQVWLVNLSANTKIRRLSDQYYGDWTKLAWSPDSKQLIVFRYDKQSGDRELAIWRTADLQKKVIYQGTSLGALDISARLYWPPQSQRILLVTDRGNQESLSLSGW